MTGKQINREGPANNYRGEHINFEDIEMTDGLTDGAQEGDVEMALAGAPTNGGITGAVHGNKRTINDVPPIS